MGNREDDIKKILEELEKDLEQSFKDKKFKVEFLDNETFLQTRKEIMKRAFIHNARIFISGMLFALLIVILFF